jgi:hypothetical protein
MPSNEAHDPRADPAREPVEEALGRLEERLDRASQAAERLLADAAQRVTSARGAGRAGGADTSPGPGTSGSAGKPPPAGWQTPAGERDPASPLLADADLLLGLVGALRNRIPLDLQQRLAEAIRELLLALRALIDWYLERTERSGSESAEIQDIPIL